MEVTIINKLIGKSNAETISFSEFSNIPVAIKVGIKNQIIAEIIKYGFLFFSLIILIYHLILKNFFIIFIFIIFIYLNKKL